MEGCKSSLALVHPRFELHSPSSKLHHSSSKQQTSTSEHGTSRSKQQRSLFKPEHCPLKQDDCCLSQERSLFKLEHCPLKQDDCCFSQKLSRFKLEAFHLKQEHSPPKRGQGILSGIHSSLPLMRCLRRFAKRPSLSSYLHQARMTIASNPPKQFSHENCFNSTAIEERLK